MIKNIASYFYCNYYFRFVLIWMHIDVTLGRKMEVGKNMPTEYAPHYSDFQLYVEGKSFYKQLFTDIREAKQSIYTYFSFCRMIKVAILFKLIKREGERRSKRIFICRFT